MKFQKLSALAVVLAAVVVGHPLGCGVFCQFEDNGTYDNERPDEPGKLNPTAEDCYNGQNDDGDGAPDCADKDCTSIAMCMAAIPEGWTGYHWIRVVNDVIDTVTDSKPCNDGWEPVPYFVGMPSENHTCPVCKPKLLDVESSCQLPTLMCWNGSNCIDGDQRIPRFEEIGVCNSFTTFGYSPTHCMIQEMPKAPTCDAPNVIPTRPKWEHRLDTCATSPIKGAGCESGLACIKQEPHSMYDQICIHASGDLGCPQNWTDYKYLAYAEADVHDSRQCTDCTCKGECAWEGYNISDNCTGGIGSQEQPVQIDSLDKCEPISQLASDGSFGLTTTNPTPTSTVNGGEPMGKLIANNPVTFCCKPGENSAD